MTPFTRDRFTWLGYSMLGYYSFTQASLGPLLPFLGTELNINYTEQGLHGSAFALGMILAGLGASKLAQRVDRRVLSGQAGQEWRCLRCSSRWGGKVSSRLSASF